MFTLLHVYVLHLYYDGGCNCMLLFVWFIILDRNYGKLLRKAPE